MGKHKSCKKEKKLNYLIKKIRNQSIIDVLNNIRILKKIENISSKFEGKNIFNLESYAHLNNKMNMVKC